MIALLADEGFDHHILHRVLRVIPELELYTVQGLSRRGIDDPAVLALAAEYGCVLLTQDFKTMLGFAKARVAAGLPMPGVIAIPQQVNLSRAVEDLIYLILVVEEGELEGQITHLPF